MDNNSKCDTALTWKVEERLVDHRERDVQLLKMKDEYWSGTAGTRQDA